MNDRDALDDLDSREARTDIGCRAVLSDPLEDVFNRPTIFNPLTVAGDGGGRMKSRAHEISVARPSARDIAMHRAGDRVMLDKIGVSGRLEHREVLGLIDRDFVGILRVQAAPCLDLVAKRKDSILLFVLAAVDGESFTRLPAPHCAFAAVQVPSDLLP